MPIYEYKCKNCGEIFEMLHLPGSNPDPVCPRCESRNCEKLISSPSFKVDGTMTFSGTTCCGAPEPCGKSCRRCK